jgi:hypothetical protein
MSGRRVLRRIFGPTRGKLTGEWRKLRNEVLNDLYFSPYIIRVITSRIMRWAGHEAHMGQRRGAYRVLVGNLREIDKLENPGIDGRNILRWIFRKLDGGAMGWIDLAQVRERWGALVNAVMALRFA